MREIKFRAWDKKVKKMLKVTSVDIRKKEVNTITPIQYKGTRYSYNDFGEVEIMQFTGLKDKNGKEIYEGDIVKGILPDSECDEPFKKMIVKYEEDGFALYRPEKEFNVSSGVYFGSLASCTLNKSIEVIGNIYENPELLK